MEIDGEPQEHLQEVIFLKIKWRDNLLLFDKAKGGYISGKLSVSPRLTPDFAVKCDDPNGEFAHLLIKTSTLPSIELVFQLTADYPSKEMPKYQITCHWLTFDQTRLLSRHLYRLWQTNSKSAILDTWATFLQEEAISFLRIENMLDLTEESSCEPPPPKRMRLEGHIKGYEMHRVIMTQLNIPIANYIISYNKTQRLKEFLANHHTCSSCLQVTPGSSTIVIKNCRHMLCHQCVEGMVASFIPFMTLYYVCPIPQCQQTISKHKVSNFMEDVKTNKAYEMNKSLYVTERKKKEGDEDEEKVAKEVVTSTEDKLKLFLAYTSASDEEKEQLITMYGEKCLSQLVGQLGSREFSQEAGGSMEVDE